MTSKRPLDGRLYNGIRRIEVSLPVGLVVELDLHITEFGYWISRSSVIEKAIRRFLDDGGIGAPTQESG
jgi:Arc/MetJ-type ribon-helix-helix transcriptional regulator